MCPKTEKKGQELFPTGKLARLMSDFGDQGSRGTVGPDQGQHPSRSEKMESQRVWHGLAKRGDRV